MYKLCITAHPSERSLTRKISNFLKLKWIKVVDLYSDLEYRQDYLSFEDVLDQSNDPKKEKIQKEIQNAEEIILIFPIWWWSFPAIMKNFFDINFSYWFAFEHNNTWWVIPKLLWKKLSIFCTCNSPIDRYKTTLQDYLKLHFEECCWMEIKNFYIFDKMIQTTEDKKNNIIKLIWEIYE